jgi:predicted transcriptional regulator
VFLSIDTQWASAILSGEKLYEYRRQPPAMDPPYRGVLYATDDTQAIVGGFETHTVETGEPDVVIDDTIRQTPHDASDVRDYFEGKDTAAAIHISSYLRYDEPLSLAVLREIDPDFTVPQNFRYLRPDDHATILQQLPYERGVPYER